jgi:hypothetical protein
MPGRLNAVTSTGGSRPGGLHISPDPLWYVIKLNGLLLCDSE